MRPVSYFVPNYATDPAFGEALSRVVEDGVCVLAYDCVVTPDSMTVGSPMECRLRIIR